VPTSVPTLSAATFDEVVRSAERPVLVDFSAPNCHPCDVVRPILAGLAEQWAGVLDVVEVDVHAHPDLGRRYDVLGTPTLVLFRDGEPVRRVVGARGRGYLLEVLAEVVSPAGT
jgi:thioredoxin 1